MTDKDQTMTRERFTTLLEVYGSSIERWPVAHRSTAGRLIGVDTEARAALAEARAFDALLDRAAARSSAVPSDLIDRIVAAAVKPRMVTTADATPKPSTNVVSITPPPLSTPSTGARRSADVFGVRRLPTAMALAASLVLGVAIGSLDLMHAPMRGLIEMAGNDGSDSGLIRLVSSLQSDGVSAVIDEDTP